MSSRRTIRLCRQTRWLLTTPLSRARRRFSSARLNSSSVSNFSHSLSMRCVLLGERSERARESKLHRRARLTRSSQDPPQSTLLQETSSVLRETRRKTLLRERATTPHNRHKPCLRAHHPRMERPAVGASGERAAHSPLLRPNCLLVVRSARARA